MNYYKPRKQPNRKRNHRILVSFSDEELAILNAKVARTAFRREVFMREVLLGCEIMEKPPADYLEIVRQLRIIGSNVHQLLLKAIQTKFIDTVILQDVYEMTVEMDDLFCESFIPDRRKWRK